MRSVPYACPSEEGAGSSPSTSANTSISLSWFHCTKASAPYGPVQAALRVVKRPQVKGKARVGTMLRAVQGQYTVPEKAKITWYANGKRIWVRVVVKAPGWPRLVVTSGKTPKVRR